MGMVLVQAEQVRPHVSVDSLFNHVSATLSQLDMEMVYSVPPGGNWQDIPLEVAKKSKRLMQIRESGGRTTYYGRMHPNHPSYTISTYFNRPGNGTFIHPFQDRLISLREGARLQSFSDSYRFLGSQSSMYKQIGNAVPPLLARSIGNSIPRGLVVDVFAGAGGLSEGLVQSGHQVIVAGDNNRNMCMTYAYNHPETKTSLSDLTNPEEFQSFCKLVEDELHGRTLQLIVGGPPCQGFSTAGKWDSTDSRNSLVVPMLRMIQRFLPEYVLIENVLGLKWMKNGDILERIIAILENIGYNTSWFKIKAESYGVPQRRRRIFVIGSRSDQYDFPEPQFASIKTSRNRSIVTYSSSCLPVPISVGSAIFDLPEIEPGTSSHIQSYDMKNIDSMYQKYMRGKTSYETFLKSHNS
ncbi:MAG: DNA (cytosine-5-)-methyltransferase [Candidatus Lokiarchaeota archaeon]|nr:DNA (cytosine-5-)-methyltransferase [Candidatus Lokiarchaeota archaeon]